MELMDQPVSNENRHSILFDFERNFNLIVLEVKINIPPILKFSRGINILTSRPILPELRQCNMSGIRKAPITRVD